MCISVIHRSYYRIQVDPQKYMPFNSLSTEPDLYIVKRNISDIADKSLNKGGTVNIIFKCALVSVISQKLSTL